MNSGSTGLRVFEGLAFSILVLIFLAGTGAWAQNVGSLRGQVTDPTGAAVPAASIELAGMPRMVTVPPSPTPLDPIASPT
jgi:hypothetical protein